MLLLAVVSMALITVMQLRQEAENRAFVTTKNLAKSLELTFDGQIDTINVSLIAAAHEIGRQISTVNPDAELITAMLMKQKERLHRVEFLRATNASGDVVFGTGLLSLRPNISDRDYFIRLRGETNTDLFVNSTLISRTNQKWVLLFARRIAKMDGSFGGVVYAAITIDDINKMFAQIRQDFSSSITLRGADLGLVARYSEPGKFYYPNDDVGPSTALTNALNENPQEGGYLNNAARFDGTSRIYSYYRSAKYGFLVNAGIANESAFAEWRSQAWIVGGLVAAFALALVTLSWLIRRSWQCQEQHISKIKAHKAELNLVANYDILTGLPSRRLLISLLEQAVARARRNGKLMAVCYLDLDGFKPINDRYGHVAADNVLVAITERLQGALRTEDTLARPGGGEFVLLFNDLANVEEIYAVLGGVLNAVIAPVSLDDIEVRLSASIGFTLFPSDDADADTLLHHADQAMYLSKENGKNRYHLFDADQDLQLKTRRHNLQRMREALENDEFVLHFQPKVDLLSGKVIGAEALIRWQHPERGLLSPGEFLHYLDGSDLEIKIGEWVVDSVLSQIEAWNAAGLDFVVSANISANHLLKSDFAERLRLSLERHSKVNPSSLELEIIETAALSDMSQAVHALTLCRKYGVQLALDDFGTGYSSLTYLRNLPVHTLKIDQSFVRDMLTDPEDLGIVECVVQLAQVFNLGVIAEGVETLEHGAMLARLGCPVVQGYGIARPMLSEQLLEWVNEWRNNAIHLTLDSRLQRPYGSRVELSQLEMQIH